MTRADRATRTRWDNPILFGVGIACVAAAVVSSIAVDWFYPAIRIGEVVVGLAFGTLGVIAWRRDRTIAWLSFATSLTWFAASFIAIALFWHRGPMLHLILRGARDRSRTAFLIAVGIAYAASVFPVVWLDDIAAAVLAVAYLAFVLIQRGSATSKAAATTFAATIVGHTLARAFVPEGGALLPSLLVYDAALVTIAVLSAAPLLRTPPARVTDLIVDLRGSRSERLRDELAAAIGDSSLLVGEWDDAAGRYVTADGAEIDAADPPSGRVTTVIDADGQHVFVLEHAPGSLDDPALLDAVAVAARVTARNAHLRAVSARRIAEVEASRRRLSTASDRSRMQLRADVERVVLSDLSALAATAEADAPLATASTAARLHDAGLRIAAIRTSIEDTIAGLAPRELSTGVMPAVRAAAQDSPQRIDVEGDLPRMPLVTELAITLACLEALTNAIKHADASRIAVRADADDTTARVTVSDDGRGGANPSGWGISGIADRIASIGGAVRIDSPAGEGTIVHITVPLTPESGDLPIAAGG